MEARRARRGRPVVVVRVPLTVVEIVYEPSRSEHRRGRWTAEIASSHLALAFGLKDHQRVMGTGTSFGTALERLVIDLYAEIEAEDQP